MAKLQKMYYYRLYTSASKKKGQQNIYHQTSHLNVIFSPNILRRDAVFCFHLFKLNQLAIDCQFECKKHFCLNNVHSMNSNAWMNSTQCMSLRSISYASGCHFVSRWLAQFCCGALSLYIFFFSCTTEVLSSH